MILQLSRLFGPRSVHSVFSRRPLRAEHEESDGGKHADKRYRAQRRYPVPIHTRFLKLIRACKNPFRERKQKSPRKKCGKPYWIFSDIISPRDPSSSPDGPLLPKRLTKKCMSLALYDFTFRDLNLSSLELLYCSVFSPGLYERKLRAIAKQSESSQSRFEFVQ
ncbi:MAG: hypothetical protein WDM76_07850 [Limisphaerales bacterium]